MRSLTNAVAAVLRAVPSAAAGGRQAARPERRSGFRRLYLLIPAVVIALALAAWFWTSRQSSSSIEVATAWGLPGVWQVDCEAPVRVDNPRYRYSIEDGKILLRRDFSRGVKDASEITDVERTSAGELRYVVHFVQLGDKRNERASRQNVLAKSADGRIRAVANKNAGTGEETVAGGVRAADNSPTPWMSRCKLE